MSCDLDHQVVGLILRQSAGINAAAFEEHERSFNAGSLVTVEVSLSLNQMKRISSGDFVHVAAAVGINVLRCRDGRLQRVFVANSVKTPEPINLVFVDRQQPRELKTSAHCRSSFRETAEQAFVVFRYLADQSSDFIHRQGTDGRFRARRRWWRRRRASDDGFFLHENTLPPYCRSRRTLAENQGFYKIFQLQAKSYPASRSNLKSHRYFHL